MIGEEVKDEHETSTALSSTIVGQEGYALTTLGASKDMKTNQDERDNLQKTILAAGTCEKLGTGGQVIFQGEEEYGIPTNKPPILRKAMKHLR